MLPDDQAINLAQSLFSQPATTSGKTLMADDQAINLGQSLMGKSSSQLPPVQSTIPGAINAQTKGANLSSDNARALIQKYFPKDQWDNAYSVMQGESGGRPDAVGDNFPINGETIPSYGLFQIRGLPGRPTPEQLLDPEFNAQYAAQMYNQQGWHPWSAARKLGLTP